MARNSNASSHGMFALASPLLKPLKLSGKLGLIGGILIVPLIGLVGLEVKKIEAERHSIQLEQAAAPLGHAILDVVAHLQDRRGLSAMRAAGADVDPLIREVDQKLAAAVKQVDDDVASVPAVGIDKLWQGWKADLSQLQ